MTCVREQFVLFFLTFFIGLSNFVEGEGEGDGIPFFPPYVEVPGPGRTSSSLPALWLKLHSFGFEWQMSTGHQHIRAGSKLHFPSSKLCISLLFFRPSGGFPLLIYSALHFRGFCYFYSSICVYRVANIVLLLGLVF